MVRRSAFAVLTRVSALSQNHWRQLERPGPSRWMIDRSAHEGLEGQLRDLLWRSIVLIQFVSGLLLPEAAIHQRICSFLSATFRVAAEYACFFEHFGATIKVEEESTHLSSEINIGFQTLHSVEKGKDYN